MTARKLLVFGTSLLGSYLLWACRRASFEPSHQRVVRLAELEIDPTRLEKYRAALREGIETSIRLEPGVLTLSAVSVKGYPSQVRIFETYADVAAYEAHLQTPHSKKYKNDTIGMVKFLKLVETDPIPLGSKGR